jgi:hypothetical protein
MSTEPLESLDPELDVLLDSERRAGAPGDALERVWSRIGPGVPPGGGRGGAGGGGAPTGWLASHAAAVAGVAFLAGGAAGAAAYARLEKPQPERIVYIEHPPAPAAAIPSVAEPWVLAPRATAAIVPQAAPAVAALSSGSLAAERMLIESARAELSAGDASHALVLLEEHVHRFAKPQLAEEREALRIQSFVALGRYDEARAVAAKFRAGAPGSLFLPAIEASIGSIP